MKCINHIGLTVHSIEQTIRFYEQLTTVEIYGEALRITEAGVAAVIGVPQPDYVSCMVRIGKREFELIEHAGSKGQDTNGGHNNVGAVHLAFMVDDIDDTFAKVRNVGAEPTTSAPYHSSDVEGYRTFFFRDPNGILVEVGCYN